MSEHLLLASIGPVQDFIAQARRTRDLWHASHLISELSRSLARALADGGARLLVPALDAGAPGLVACWAPVRPDTGEPPEAVANKVWALVPEDRDPELLARSAREQVLGCLREHAARVWAKLGDELRKVKGTEAVWREQVDDALEFAAGWLALGERPFADVRAELDDALTARKRLRDFQPWVCQRGGQRKSSLDGARETVLPPRKSPARVRLQRALRLGDNEELDAIGLIKRAGAKPEHFTPLVNVALGPWLNWVAKHHGPELARCRRACLELGVQRLRSPMLADDFRFEASILLPDRWPSLEKEHGYDDPERQPEWKAAQAAVMSLRNAARAARDEPYVACLVADGDRMGDAISRLDDPESLRRFSAELSTFAEQAREIVREAGGSLVYAGGDDVLAFVPVVAALDCADALRHRFETIVGETCRRLELVDDEHPTPTLSVGVGVGHYMESMGSLLELGREAEALAKGSRLPRAEQRNALAILVDKRSGGRRRWRSRWPSGPCERLREDMRALSRLSITKIHEIDALVRQLPTGPASDDLSVVLEGEVARSLARNESLALAPADVGLELPVGPYVDKRQAVLDWIDRLLIARELRRADLRPNTPKDP